MLSSLLASGVLLFVSPAQADTVHVDYIGLLTGKAVSVTRPDGEVVGGYASTNVLEIDGETVYGYCVDLDNPINPGNSYEANLVSMPAESPWCEINALLSTADASAGGVTGTVIQVAIWKLLEPGLVEADPVIDAAADDLVAEVEGQCPLTCDEEVAFTVATTENLDGTVTFDVALERSSDVTVAGQAVELYLSGGTLVQPADGLATTDADGGFTVVVEPGDASTFDLSFTAGGQTLIRVEPTVSYQQLIAFAVDECSFEDDVTWTAGALGDPRTIGFWKHQLAVATGRNPGSAQISAATLEGFLPIEVFGTSYGSLAEVYSTLWISRATMQQRAQQQCLALNLNVASGQAGWFSDVDGMALWELYDEAAYAYDNGDYETAKTICDDFNNL
ncbi:hypothetical protein L6R53_27655 [Myxococcota bacterium]|nr:hypothetical protein [Myxococcota bacterium]